MVRFYIQVAKLFERPSYLSVLHHCPPPTQQPTFRLLQSINIDDSLNSPNVLLSLVHVLLPLCMLCDRAENLYKRTHTALSWSSFKSLCNRCHNLILTSKKQYYSNLIFSVSDNPRRPWQTVNKLLCRKSASPLPTSSSFTSLADSFASFFTDKIS